MGAQGITRVIGVGSPHADDQVAWRCVEILQQTRCGIADVIKIADPIRLLDHLAGCTRLFIIDSCVTGASVGSIVKFRWPEERLDRATANSTHAFSVGQVLDLAEALQILPPSVVVFGIEIEPRCATFQLNPAIQSLLPEIVERICREIEHSPNAIYFDTKGANSCADRGRPAR